MLVNVVTDLVRRGDRFRVTRAVEAHVRLIGYAPAHTAGVACVIPSGAVIVALDQVAGSTMFACYPEEYDRMEHELIPEHEREGMSYAGRYVLTFAVSAIGELLELMEPADPRPPNELPRVRGRPSARQRAELARYEALRGRIDALEYDRVEQITDRTWLRRQPGQTGSWEVPTPDGATVALEVWEVWFDQAPGTPPRAPDVRQPGSTSGPAGRIWDHHAAAKSGL